MVFDNAAAFAVVRENPGEFLGPIPSVFELPRRKSLGIGEGGCVVCTDHDRVHKIKTSLNFGFDCARDSLVPSINGKMNEYTPAVGLAALDRWEEKLQAIRQVSAQYCRELPSLPDWPAAFWAGRASTAAMLSFRARLSSRSITIRRESFTAAVSNTGSGTEMVCTGTSISPALRTRNSQSPNALGDLLLGIPMAPDLPQSAISRVVAEARRSAASNAEANMLQGAIMRAVNAVGGRIHVSAAGELARVA